MTQGLRLIFVYIQDKVRANDSGIGMVLIEARWVDASGFCSYMR